MCTRFYVEPASYQSLIARAQRIQLANDIMVKLGKPLTMCGEMCPTDVVAVLAPNNVRSPKGNPQPQVYQIRQKTYNTQKSLASI